MAAFQKVQGPPAEFNAPQPSRVIGWLIQDNTFQSIYREDGTLVLAAAKLKVNPAPMTVPSYKILKSISLKLRS